MIDGYMVRLYLIKIGVVGRNETGFLRGNKIYLGYRYYGGLYE